MLQLNVVKDLAPFGLLREAGHLAAGEPGVEGVADGLRRLVERHLLGLVVRRPRARQHEHRGHGGHAAPAQDRPHIVLRIGSTGRNSPPRP